MESQWKQDADGRKSRDCRCEVRVGRWEREPGEPAGGLAAKEHRPQQEERLEAFQNNVSEQQDSATRLDEAEETYPHAVPVIERPRDANRTGGVSFRMVTHPPSLPVLCALRVEP